MKSDITAMKILILLLSLLIMAQPIAADVYKWTDEKGILHYSDSKPENQEAEKIFVEVNSYESVSYVSTKVDIGKKVVMYSTSWCGYCKKARKYFNRKKIPYTEYDIEKNARAKSQYKKLGAKGVPVILVGKKRMNGFSEAGFERIYQ